MNTLQLLNSVQKVPKYFKLVTLESILLPPYIQDNKIHSLVTTPKITGGNFQTSPIFKLFTWDITTQEFLGAQEINLPPIDFEMPYLEYCLNYIEVCKKVDKSKSNHLSEYFPQLEKIYKHLK